MLHNSLDVHIHRLIPPLPRSILGHFITLSLKKFIPMSGHSFTTYSQSCDLGVSSLLAQTSVDSSVNGILHNSQGGDKSAVRHCV